MKKNMLAVLIAGTFLVACSDGSGLSSKSIQVFDGPVQFADVVANCGGEIWIWAGLTLMVGLAALI